MSRFFRLRRALRGEDQGVTLMETALVLPLLLVLVLGLVEAGAAAIDWLAVSNASREGARVGAMAGNADEADDNILRVIAQASCAIENGELTDVRIYESDNDGNPISGLQNHYSLETLSCPGGTATWSNLAFGWPPSDRSNKMGSLDMLGVEVEFQRQGITGLVGVFDGTWTDTAVFRIDPDTRGDTAT